MVHGSLRLKMLGGLVCALCFLAASLPLVKSASAAVERAVLAVSDCNKCHWQIVGQLAERGGGHREVMDCLDCHQEHPPRGLDAVPECGLCHETVSAPHYSVKACLACHDPHAPRDIDLSGANDVRPVCLGCHDQPEQDLQQYPSAHAGMDCNACHQRHGEFFECLECHEPHSEDLDSYADCRICHNPHKPLIVRYPDNLAVSYCSSCHVQQADALRSTQLKHGTFNCTFCHRSQHRSLPVCGTCHGYPHSTGLHQKFNDCGICHSTAHELEM